MKIIYLISLNNSINKKLKFYIVLHNKYDYYPRVGVRYR